MNKAQVRFQIYSKLPKDISRVGIARLRFFPIFIAILFVVAGCASNQVDSPEHRTPDSRFNQRTFDAHFLDEILVYGNRSILIAELGAIRAREPQIRALAQNILVIHSREVKKVKGWRNSYFSDLSGAAENEENVDFLKLEQSPAIDFDTAFIVAMKAREQIEIGFAEQSAEFIENPEVRHFVHTLFSKSHINHTSISVKLRK